MSLVDYFLLDVGKAENLAQMTTEPTLGSTPPKRSLKKVEKNRRNLRHTLFLYSTVAVGVLAQFIAGNILEIEKGTFGSLSFLKLFLAFVVAAIIFPAVYRGASFDRCKEHPVQYFIAFQNGFFWQALLQVLARQ